MKELVFIGLLFGFVICVAYCIASHYSAQLENPKISYDTTYTIKILTRIKLDGWQLLSDSTATRAARRALPAAHCLRPSNLVEYYSLRQSDLIQYYRCLYLPRRIEY